MLREKVYRKTENPRPRPCRRKFETCDILYIVRYNITLRPSALEFEQRELLDNRRLFQECLFIVRQYSNSTTVCIQYRIEISTR